jgi:hypothetical protein
VEEAQARAALPRGVGVGLGAVRKLLRQRGWAPTTFYRKLDGGSAHLAAIPSERGVVVR